MKMINNNNGSMGIAIAILLIIICIVSIALLIQSAWATEYYITGTVKDKWIDVGNDESYYLLKITLPDGNDKMLEVNRNILHGSNYNPDFVYSDIEIGKKYQFKCWGWDWQWADVYMYPMVIIADEV